MRRQAGSSSRTRNDASAASSDPRTLVSLAILKAHVDQGRDYLDYLRPFVVQTLSALKTEPVNADAVCAALSAQFGLVVPARSLELVLKRLARAGVLAKESGVYHLVKADENGTFAARKAEALRQISTIVSGFQKFASSEGHPFETQAEAVSALSDFLQLFSIDYLKSFLQGTVIPQQKMKRGRVHPYLISKYVLKIQERDAAQFANFAVLLQGHMLANALLCPDLANAPGTFSGVKFYLDTPLLVRCLGLEGERRKEAATELLRLIGTLDGALCTFEHLRTELESVIRGAAEYMDQPLGRGRIVMDARESGRTMSDLLVIAGKLGESLAALKVVVEPTPTYDPEFQIDEEVFEDVLEDEVSYYNRRAREYDINSIRSIYALRRGRTPMVLEKAGAVLVTTNAGLARAAWEFGQQHESTREVSSTITEFSLANVAWLKAPMAAPHLPESELLAVAYAASRPSTNLLSRFLEEVEKLEKLGRISARDHQLLRSHVRAQEELMNLTMGEEAALSAETVTGTLARVKGEITAEEQKKRTIEEEAHAATRGRLQRTVGDLHRVQQQASRIADGFAACAAWTLAGLWALFLVVGVVAGLGFGGMQGPGRWVVGIGVGVLAVATVLNLFFGHTVAGLHYKARAGARRWALARVSKFLGLPAPPDVTPQALESTTEKE